MKKIFSFIILGLNICVFAQELQCTVKVNFEKISGTNQKIFKTLETSLNEFVNKTTWSSVAYLPVEKINCSMTINIDSYENDQFTGSILVQSSRPVYNTTYATPIFNFNDKNFNFKYQEFENLTYSPNHFDSNLVAVIAYYAHLIIGFDQDTFLENGGQRQFITSQSIAALGETSGYKGWSENEKNLNRYVLINDLLSNTYNPFRQSMFQYNFDAMDTMSNNIVDAKQTIIKAVENLKKIHEVRPNSVLARVFFDAKSDEIVSIFSAGPSIDLQNLLQTLNQISPLNSSKWNTLN